ncbi:MAG: alkaline phosphatase family protein [Sideroxydans sp.]|nr:alkaline phosphatase family protein [Sideroxydans sp.]
MKQLVAGLLLCGAAAQVQAVNLPRPDHILIVIEENKSFSQIIGNPDAPYINALAQRGALFTNAHGVTHPSQPNYLALFNGTTRGIGSNTCPLDLSGDNLASALLLKGRSFVSYSESMPKAGYEGCRYGSYMRKHNPLANWKELSALNQPLTAMPQDFAQLPDVAWVVPDQRNDMHDGSIAQGDAWLQQNIEAYAQWAMDNNSLLIVTFDEDDGSEGNRVVTLMVGPMVKAGQYAQRIDHYNVLRTILQMHGLPGINESARAESIDKVWR